MMGSLFETGRERAKAETPGREDGAWRLSREQVVDQILTINPSAGRSFLEQFGADGLSDYLDRLINARSPRGRESRYVRRGDTPAIVGGARGRRR